MREYINYKNGSFADLNDLNAFAKDIDLSKSTVDYAGVPVFGIRDKIKVLDHDTHSICFGTTGAMKTTRYLLPSAIIIALKGESMIINDPKGEIYSKLQKLLKEKGYNIILLNFRDPMIGNRWNPLKLAQKLYEDGEKDRSDMYLRDFGTIIYNDITKHSEDVFWGQCSTDYFVGLSQIIRDETDGEPLTIENIRLTNAQGFEKTMGNTSLKHYYLLSNKLDEKILNIEATVMAPNDTLACIRSIFSQSLNIYGLESLRDMMATSDFDMTSIGTQKTAVFMVTPPERTSFNPIISAFIKQSYSALIDLVASRNPNGALPIRLNYLLDEFSNLVKIPDFSQMITMARSANIRFNLVVQSLTQLYSVYSQDEAENILNNCEAWFVFRSKDLVLHDMVSRMCGTKIYTHTREERPLITSTDIQKLSKNDGEVLLMLSGMDPMVTYLPSIYELSIKLDQFDISKMPARKPILRPVFKIDVLVQKMIDDEQWRQGEALKEKFIREGTQGIEDPFDHFRFKVNSDLKLDELIAKIDAKIQEYEDEEARMLMSEHASENDT